MLLIFNKNIIASERPRGRAWCLALSLGSVIAGFIRVRRLLSHLQLRRGGTILTGSALETVFNSANENTFMMVSAIEILLVAITVGMVLKKKWPPLSLSLLLVYAAALFAASLSWFSLGSEGSP
jgi:glucose-6-phosphate-specific signal transduction histidine kinase